MTALDLAIAEMDFDFLGSGKHSISVDGFKKAMHDEQFLMLDVRTNEEQDYMRFPFATHIPLNELPKRHQELPADKCIVVFCTSIFRGALAYAYLRAQGFAEVKGLAANIEELVAVLKPGPLAKMRAGAK